MRQAVIDGDMLKRATEMKATYILLSKRGKTMKRFKTQTERRLKKQQKSVGYDGRNLKSGRGVVPAGRPCNLFQAL